MLQRSVLVYLTFPLMIRTLHSVCLLSMDIFKYLFLIQSILTLISQSFFFWSPVYEDVL